MNDLLTILSVVAGISAIAIFGYTLFNFKGLLSSQAKPFEMDSAIHPIPTNISQREKEEDLVSLIEASRDIAEQLNLLALNSAITEARTTGSFGTVSEEVRSIAVRAESISTNVYKLVEESKKVMVQIDTEQSLLSKYLDDRLSAVEIISDGIRNRDKLGSRQYLSRIDTSQLGKFEPIISYENLETHKTNISRLLDAVGSVRVTTNKAFKSDS
ncbi:methyl-accepting chemotaxis protein [Vibrio parahaemolyticus]|uniref:methyl-accepting chemotaxis protein n=1 Tax=Vibrio parahaemolyticus TaxID=670 RepID=UPI001122F1A3|nr:methyl-accepting chemotaxis protein [Vibrio parahaemolyticus]MBE4182992.1 hypothetical protein [Vibrio parahaemolyticus]TOQ65510.1 hypothetical protein CGG90_23180 [Vibrio parahaemolyticus]